MKRSWLLVSALALFPVLGFAQIREVAPRIQPIQTVRAPIVPLLAVPAALSALPAVPVLAAPTIVAFEAPSIEPAHTPTAKVARFVRNFILPFAKASQIDLSSIDPADTSELGKHAEKKALKKLEHDKEKLQKLQKKLYADGKRSVLVVLQGMDTSGKDGTIKHVLGGINPQGVEVANFKKPTAEEASHHYLWRLEKALVDKGIVTKEMAGNGRIGVFNRSQYEDILVPSVYGTFSPEEIEKRYEEINQWEKKLVESGVVIVKLFLHISKDEQKARLQARLDEEKKNWKFSVSDLETRRKWDEFQASYEKILARTSTPWAPWHVIPADNKWYRNFIVGRILKKTMKAMGLRFPPAPEGLENVVIPD